MACGLSRKVAFPALRTNIGSETAPVLPFSRDTLEMGRENDISGPDSLMLAGFGIEFPQPLSREGALHESSSHHCALFGPDSRAGSGAGARSAVRTGNSNAAPAGAHAR